jgi:hypothetical protein
MTITNIQVTFYQHTGYSVANEPASDAVINLNTKIVMPVNIRVKNPWKLDQVKVEIDADTLQGVDFIKLSATEGRWYYYVLGYESKNEVTTILNVALDSFATVGLSNISFFGNIVRRSLSAAEAQDYPLLAEPWTPKRPLLSRRLILDLNVNKTEVIPSRISTVFEDDTTNINNSIDMQVPNNVLIPTSYDADNLSMSATLPMRYPNAAVDTPFTINTPWGIIPYTVPKEQYFQLNGQPLIDFLQNAKLTNSLDLISNPYCLPDPEDTQTVSIPEVSTAGVRNPKAKKHYTTLTIRSLASGSSRTFSYEDTDLTTSQELSVIVVPDKDGGIYVIPTSLRDTGLTAYTYLEGVYSPFETIVYNAIGDTPAKFAADGTVAMNQALSNLFLTYAQKINTNQYENMQTNYFKDVISSYGTAAGLLITVLGTTTYTDGFSDSQNFETTSHTLTNSTSKSYMVSPGTTTPISRTMQGISTTKTDVKSGMPSILEAPDGSMMSNVTQFWNAIKGAHQNEVHNFMLGNINDYLNRWASVQNDIHNGKVANLFKNVTMVGSYGDTNKLAGKYEIIITSLRQEDIDNFDMFLDHFGHQVDEYSDTLVQNAKPNFNYTMIGDDAVITNTVRSDANAMITAQFKAGVRVWNTLIRAENFD